jgi:hypothetical protein
LSRPWVGPALVVAAVAATAGGVLLLPADVPAPPASPAGVTVPSGPRRLPVVGSAGRTLVVAPDGSGYIEGPAGRVDITAAPADATARLYVTEAGVVEVPAASVVTFVGEDVVVAVAPNGAATAYYADGRIEVRAGTSARPKPQGGRP